MAEKSAKRPRPRSSGRRPPSPPIDLVRACVANECVLYAGSGLSAQAELPTWKPFVSGLLDWAVRSGHVERGFAGSLREALEQEPDLVADSIVSLLGSETQPLHQYLRETFFFKAGRLPDVHRLLRRLSLGAVLTTNFDNLLERSFRDPRVHTPHDAEPLLEALAKREFFVLKLYGDLLRPETVLITPAEYQAAVAENLLFSRFMEGLFVSRTLLFLGASLDGILGYLGGLKFRGQRSLRRHYALVDVTGGAWKAKADLLERRYGIQVLTYTASEGYPEILAFLRELERLVKAERARSGAASSLEPDPGAGGVRLLRARLENIGPFEDQTFELGRPWSVLLGDNGVGKSSVLRAIAVGLCGENARPYAARLLRKGTNGAQAASGTITLEIRSEVNNEPVVKTFVTKILRTDSGVEIQTLPTIPLEVEGWLALGFPPLRSMSWKRESEPLPPGRERPVATDLLPLVSGEVDPRLDKLKNWLIELDHQIQTDLAKKVSEPRARRLRDDFFHVLGELTPGLTLDLASVVVDSREILVETDDGTVPIEAVSQGTSSLMGWIGVLLRRLYTLYGDEPRPRERYALVLIDEIDAHMHPEWQRFLVPQIRKLFPGLQIVASTHSPLLVPSLRSGEILRLQRDPRTRRVAVTAPGYDVQSYRAGQILTSPLFGLPSSLAPEREQQVARYTQLAAREELEPEEREEMAELARELDMKVPSEEERAEARIAYQLIQHALDEHVADLDPEVQERVVEEMKVQLQELVTGSRRP